MFPSASIASLSANAVTGKALTLGASDVEALNHVATSVTATPANNVYGLRSTMTLDAASGGKSFGALLGHNKVAAGSLYDYNMVRGLYGYADNYGSGNVTNLDGVYSVVTSRGTGRTQIGAGLYTVLDLSSTGIMDNYYGVRVNPASVSGSPTLTNFYGFFVAPSIGTGAQNAWGFYNSSTNWSYFGGKVGIGNSLPFADLQILRLTNGLGPVFMLQNQNGTSNSSGAIDFALSGTYSAPITSARLRGVRVNYPANQDTDLAIDCYDAGWGGLKEKLRVTARGDLLVAGSIIATNTTLLPRVAAGPTVTNGAAGFWNSNGTVFLRFSAVGYTTNGDARIFP